MSTMVERVARAMAEVNDHHQEFAIGDFRDAYMDQARAAIEAMREPTEAMVDSCGNGECAKWARGAWANYIDAALQEQEQG